MAKRILAYHFALLVLFTNTWTPVFTHLCHGQSKAWSSVFMHARTCCSKKKEVKKAACHPETPKTKKQGIRQQPCCENQLSFLHQQSDFSNALPSLTAKELQKAAPVLPLTNQISINSFFENVKLSFQPHAPPVQLHGRSLLIFEQVFLC